MQRSKPRPIRQEDREQTALVSWYRLQYPRGPLLVMIPNGVRLSKAQAGKAKGMGMTAGVPDLALLAASGGHHGLFIEMKARSPRTGKIGSLSADQRSVHAVLEKRGYKVVTPVGWQEAAEAIKAYLAS